ncbi:MAG TPA: glycerol-3-phosphate 1-O-acyltransferase PlsY [Acidimicrobiia bacterium]
MKLAIAIIGAYVIGSIDFALVVARMRGIDIREVGSGNPGTSNVLRTMGKGPAALVLLGDTLKGVMGAFLGTIASESIDPTVHWVFLSGLAAVVGHCYPVFHRLKGGRGVATGLGVLLYSLPWLGLGVLGGWLILLKLTKVAAVSSLIVTLVSLPVAWFLGVRDLGFLWLCLMVALIIFRHRSNIMRMVRGSEQKVPT